MWQAIGVDLGGIWLTGGVYFEHAGTVHLSLGSRPQIGDVDGLFEVLGSE